MLKTMPKITEFRNEPFTDFSLPDNQKAMEAALAHVRSQLGRTYPLVIGAEEIETGQWTVSTNPARPAQEIGRFAKAGRQEADKAMTVALNAFKEWRKTLPSQRAECLVQAAEIMRQRKFELAAWMILEIGKNWAEADADVAEAIDFCEFYAREMIRLSKGQELPEYASEKNKLEYIPLGVGVVIPPWNFPLAILTGMTTAAIVSGNTVILKPSSETPATGQQFVNILHEIGLPAGVVTYLPGSGPEVGDYLVSHKKTRFVAFTGSKEVGLRINELAARPQPGQIWIKRVIAEMGGKDAIVVDREADLDAAAEGIVASAFGYQGQKCSACSRTIIHKDVYDTLLDMIVKRTEALKVGSAEDCSTNMGPVSSKAAFETILNYVETGKKEGRLVTGGKPKENADGGYFIEPTVIADVDPKARIAQEEVFGPVLAVTKADSWSHALAIANDSEYGLTGAVYSTNRQHLDEAAREFHVGNLYLNRKCTGALVGVHPFGGFNMSGTDSKTGGKDYLLLFTQAKVVSERVQ